MRRRFLWLLIGLLCLGGLAYFWRAGNQRQATHETPATTAATTADSNSVTRRTQPANTFQLLSERAAAKAAEKASNSSRFVYRLSNTKKTVGQLAKSDSGILLANALIDTAESTKVAIPEHLRAPENNGSYIVQARGPIDAAFRSLLQSSGASIVSYVPNNAYLVRASQEQVSKLSASGKVQSVLDYAPYYKLDPGLLKLAVEEKPLPESALLKVTVFPGARDAAVEALNKLGVQVTEEERSPFGPLLTVAAKPETLVAMAVEPSVQLIQVAHPRMHANDQSRTNLHVSFDTVVATNYLNLTGSNVLVAVNDTGVDATHPDLADRVFPDQPGDEIDTIGHGTHVAGIIASSGETTTNNPIAAEGSLTNANFRGIAPAARVLSINLNQSDSYLQERVARTNARISNNSWGYVNLAEYSIEAASYDAAVRDALPSSIGPQPVLFVFSAGNSGSGQSIGLNGDPDSILSPGTAKNVITVGALEQNRNITNQVYFEGETNQFFLGGTDSSDEVANYSSRGNVGIGIEGEFGRFKPDVVAPGTFVVSTRSAQWDTNSYYNPISHEFNFLQNWEVEPDDYVALPPIFIQENAIGLRIRVLPNRLSPVPFPTNIPVYVKYGRGATPQVFDVKGQNTVRLPEDFELRHNTVLFYSVGNPTNETLFFNVETDILYTNNYGTYFEVLSNLNEKIGPYYRYESGTSMAAANVSGMLALMQEFFEQRLHLTNSPALMKALLINGARSAGPLYDNQVRNSINFQGWGLPNLTNSIPMGMTNLIAQPDALADLPVKFFDQHPTNALATDQRKTRNLTLSAGAQTKPLRVTLVWTDPPGNPNVGIKLVNDLDLIITNLTTGDIYYGNDIPAGSDFNQSWDTNTAPNIDLVNNVENIYLPAPLLGTNYSITVHAKRVNVNAVTANTNNVVQDYALVISSGNGDVTNALTFVDTPQASTNLSHVSPITNGVPALAQRVGGNSQYSGSTNGVLGQWNFYVYTNTNNHTNVAFVTFLPPEIGVPRMGTREDEAATAGRPEADVDLFVSTDQTLTNLNPIAINNAYQSHTRTGTEKVLLSNSSKDQTYYIGVRSEDQQGAEYSLLAVSSELPFGQRDPNGNIIVTMLASFPVTIPDGSPASPGHTAILGVTTEPDAVRRVIVTNEVTHENFGDLLGALTHERKLVALNNHSFFDTPGINQRFVYDDSDQNDITGPIAARKTDGPGSLRDFVGQKASDGIWMLTMVDDALTQTGRVEFAGITLEPQSPTNNVRVTLGAHSYWGDFIDVPPEATNLTVSISITGPNPLQVMLRRGRWPTLNVYDKKATINPPGGSVSITKYDSPPLNPGRYFILVYNPNLVPVTFNISKTLGINLVPVKLENFYSEGSKVILDDAVTYSTNRVNIHSKVVKAEVGVRIDHPRVSDLVLTLISPQGTRVLLAENRGQLNTEGYGSGVDTTNVFPQTTSGGANAATQILNVGSASGTILISYNFLQAPDSMHIYYDGNLIFDTGLISGTGSFSVDFGPGASQQVVILMNEGNNPNPTTQWSYAATVISRSIRYAVFSEDTNFATAPIKFVLPPFTTNGIPGTNFTVSGFEGATVTNYFVNNVVDGWTVLSNRVTVVNNPAVADSGNKYLALRNGTITRLLPTMASKNYVLNLRYRQSPPMTGIVSWWPGETGANDIVDGNNGTLINGATTGAGMVGNALNFNGINQYARVTNSLNLNPVGSFSFEGWMFPRQDKFHAIIAKWGDLGDYSNQRSYTFDITPGRGVQLGISDTANQGNGLFHNFVSTNNSIILNAWNHVAAVYDQTTGRRTLYVNGVQIAQRTDAPITIKNTPTDVGIGATIPTSTSAREYFNGFIDELTYYSRTLTAAEIQDIYFAAQMGKCGTLTPPALCPPGIANILVDGANVATITGQSGWVTQSIPFTAVRSSTPITISSSPDKPGLILDSITLTEAGGAAMFLPEEPLSGLTGENAYGDWKLEIVDNRAGATNPLPVLVSWRLSLLLDTIVPSARPLTHGLSYTNTANTNEIKYYLVEVPDWARFATNLLINASGPVNLIFNQNALPGTGPNDVTLLLNSTGGTRVLTTNGPPPLLQPGQRYYLGVKNSGTAPVDFSIEVDFDITPLSNAVPSTGTLVALQQPRYYQFDVSPSGQAAAFELLNLNGSADLVVSKGAPLPDLSNYLYISQNPGSMNESVIVLTNTLPVPLSPGRWYLGVFNNDILPVTYTIRATEAGPPTIIDLTNGVPYTFSSAPGVALTNFFRFVINQSDAAALFELYNLSGNVDLTLQRGSLPYTQPYQGASFNPGLASEQIVIRSNILQTNLNAEWFLGVPNNDPTIVTYTIRAIVSTNGMLISGVPINVNISIPPPAIPSGPTLTWSVVDGETYQVQTSTDLVTWAVDTTSVATGSTMVYVDPTPITGIPVRFYRIVQVPGP